MHCGCLCLISLHVLSSALLRMCLQGIIGGCRDTTWVTTIAGRRRHLPHIRATGKNNNAERSQVRGLSDMYLISMLPASCCTAAVEHEEMPRRLMLLMLFASSCECVACPGWLSESSLTLCCVRCTAELLPCCCHAAG